MKRRYTRPAIRKVTIDREISLSMASFSPGNDPESRLRFINPLKWLR